MPFVSNLVFLDSLPVGIHDTQPQKHEEKRVDDYQVWRCISSLTHHTDLQFGFRGYAEE